MDSSLHTWQLHGWLDRAQAGDATAHEELLRRTGARLERLARKMLGRFPTVRGVADTGDVLQNSLLRLLRALREVRPPSVRDFFGLAAEQMRRELLDLARQAGRHRRVGVGAKSDDTANPEAPDITYSANEQADLDLWQRFHEAVEQLPAEEREVIGLKFYHGWTQPQIAELFQVDERTVRRRWQSACLKLNQLIGDKMPRT
jgi:RNA polymerase sigma factor (sigma-70 family)